MNASGVVARERLLDIAEELMSRRGYAGTSVAEIVGAAGVGPPTLYWHFKNKEGILAAVMERGAERWLDSLPAWNSAADGTPRERFLTIVGVAGRSVADAPQFLRLLLLLSLERGADDEAVIASVRSIRHRARDWMSGLLRHAWPDLPPAAAEDLAFKMMSFADGWCLQQMIEPDRTTFKSHMWLNRVIADEAEALVAQRLRKSRAVRLRR